jgi:hypothetical protein
MAQSSIRQSIRSQSGSRRKSLPERDIRAMPQVALLIDEYYEEWTKLWFILVRGTAKLLPKSAAKERARVIRQLRKKYAQYATRRLLPDDAAIIRITPERIAFWGKI